MASKIKLEDFSNGSIKSSEIDGRNHHEWEGTAIFDVLMKSVNSNLMIQFDNGRIVGPDYAQVYMASIQSCIEEAMKYLLNRDLVEAQIAQVEAEKDKILADKDYINLQASLYPDTVAKDLALKDAQINKTNTDREYTQAQLEAYPETVAKDLAVKEAQINKISKDADLVEKQINNFDDQAEKDLAVKEAQLQKTNTDRDYVQAQLDAYPATAAKDLELKQAQINKLNQEKELAGAQTTVFPAQSAKELEVKQAQIELYNRQKQGFDDNKYQKLFEAQMNAWALMFSSGLLTDKPQIISNDSASALYNTLKPL